jgi:RimJ/RimL family protein N-acetyltransferase
VDNSLSLRRYPVLLRFSAIKKIKQRLNALGQPIGPSVRKWKPRPLPRREVISGKYCQLEPLSASVHGAELDRANAVDEEGRLWTYLPYGPFASYKSYSQWLSWASDSKDPLFFAVRPKEGSALGVAAFMRMDPANGSIELGHINFSPALQRTRAATEAIFLMLSRAFDDLGYRRVEWKCDSLNAPSWRAAERFGFRFEGIFRQSVVYKGRSPDTAWFSIIDSEWQELRREFRRWLAPSNFDRSARQKTALGRHRK